MQLLELNADLRTQTGKNQAYRLRQSGKIPAVYYGKGEENLMLTVDPKALEKAVSSKSGMNTILKLKVEGKGDFNARLKDYQADTITRKFTHADFTFVDLTKKIQVAIPVHLTGLPDGVKNGGGILQHITRELEVLCLPTNIPQEIVVDVVGIKLGHNLHLSDITLPEGVEAFGESDVTIASVLVPRPEEVLTPGVLTEPEVLTAKKVEGEAGAAASGDDKKADAKKPEAKK